jgi:fatty acid desaturase
MESAQPVRVAWYRSPVTREQLQQLNQRSNFKGSLQTAGYLGLLAATGIAASFAWGRLAWPYVGLLFFVHGMFWAFIINGFHEFVHNSVFETKSVNVFFAHLFAFLGWYNPYEFWASHTEHHKYTLHPPADLEVVLPVKLTLGGFLEFAFVNPRLFWFTLRKTIRLACGRLEGPWENALFPPEAVRERRRLVHWARYQLAGQAAILAASIAMQWWWLMLAVTFAPFCGGWLHYLCNNSQHAGLQDNVPDFRLCCRTITLNPFVEFLYWHMNYHTEHHMYAAVPCYQLRDLHAVIQSDLPPTVHGLVGTWRQIGGILTRQKVDPRYQYRAPLPEAALSQRA